MPDLYFMTSFKKKGNKDLRQLQKRQENQPARAVRKHLQKNFTTSYE
jgi:hypothetical protein